MFSYFLSGVVSLLVSLVSYFLINVVIGWRAVNKFKNMYFNTYISPLICSAKELDVSKGINDRNTAAKAETFSERIKYSLENELYHLNSSYTFKIIRIAEFTLFELSEINSIGNKYEFSNSTTGQSEEFLAQQKNKMLSDLNGWKCNVKKYYNLDIDIDVSIKK